MHNLFRAALVIGAIVSSAFAWGQAPAEVGKLTHVDSIPRQDLADVNCVAISGDGKFVYATAWSAGCAVVFSRDENTGRLTHVQTVESGRDLDGLTSIVLGADDQYAAGSAFQSQTAVLFSRNAESGKLRLMDVARNEQNAVRGLSWAIDVDFSPDGKHLYVCDPKGPGRSNPAEEGQRGAITAFEVTENDKLRWIEANLGKDGCFDGARGITLHANGKWAYVASNNAGCVSVLNRDAKTGKLSVAQVVRDEENGVKNLAGAMTPLLSPDQKFLYVCTGRFSGDNGVSAFKVNDDGKLSLVHELSAEFGDIENFVGGNVPAISPDGRNVYAPGTRSGSLACFDRDEKTGKLTWRRTLGDDSGAGELGGAAGVCVSPDGQFVYVAAEFDSALSVYRRETPK